MSHCGNDNCKFCNEPAPEETLESKILDTHLNLFENYVYVDSETTLNLLITEILTNRSK